MKKTLFALIASLMGLHATAQVPFSTIDSININKINAAVMVHGDLWWFQKPGIYESRGFFPNGTNLSFGGLGNAVWMSGYDGGGQLHIAAATYRQDGNDYWPGPLDNNDTLSYPASHDWARIWKVNKTDIDAFRALGTHTISNTHPTLLSWPAKGNPYAAGNGSVPLSVTDNMAPFVDVNGDGSYNALTGDYPAIKGDQALWWVFSDNGPAHTETDGRPLKVEVHAMAYAYSRGTLIDNVVYYDYEIVNKSDNDYHDFRFAFRADMDLGYYLDDYIGFDSSHRMAVQYNAVADDGMTAAYPKGSYGTGIPVLGVTLVSLPGDGSSTYVPAGSFTYYNNDFSIIGNPAVDTEYNNYMRGKMRSGLHLSYDFTGPGHPSTGTGSGPATNYMFTGDPGVPGEWSECAAGNYVGDRKFVLGSNDFNLPSGSSKHVVMALLVTDTSSDNHCPTLNFSGIRTLADTAWQVYHNDPVSVGSPVKQPETLSLYPNPVNKYLHVGINYDIDEQVNVLDPSGRVLDVPMRRTATEAILDLGNLAPGMYMLRYVSDNVMQTAKFTKY